jgi:hypothetical protein
MNEQSTLLLCRDYGSKFHYFTFQFNFKKRT